MDSTELFALRKATKEMPPAERLTELQRLRLIGLRLVAHDSDEWNQKALGHILIDLCKAFSAKGQYALAQQAHQDLAELTSHDVYINNSVGFLAKLVDPFHGQISALNEQSKAGQYEAAVTGFKHLTANGNLNKAYNETYGWAIYRLLKNRTTDFDSVGVRCWLKAYLDLENDRPSMLHSQILNWTMKYAESDPNLRTMDFLKIWNGRHFQHEDFRETTDGDVTYSSLYSRLCRRLIADPRGVDVGYLLSTVNTQPGYGDEENDIRIVDGLREPYFWKLFKLQKEGKLGKLWQEFTTYATEYGQYPPSHWHSEILQLANRFMKEANEYRFLPFFKAWNPENLRKEDWKETKKGELSLPPKAKKALKTACSQALKKAVVPGSLDWLVAACKEGKKRIPKDEYLPRDFAQMLNHNGQTKEAIAAYRKLALTLGDKYYVWKEFADLMGQDQLPVKAGMLAKALTLERNEDFLGDVRLNMAACLLELEGEAGAAYELDAYLKHRTLQGWKVDDRYAQLSSRLPERSDAKVVPAYRKLVTTADEFAFANVPWVNMIVINRYKNKEGKQKVKLYAPPKIEEAKDEITAWLHDDPVETVLAVNPKRFNILKKIKPGATLRVKYHKVRFKEHVHTDFRPLLIEQTEEPAWSVLPFTHAAVDYINKDKKVAHALSPDGVQVFFPLNAVGKKLKKGDFVSGRILEETRKEGGKRVSFEAVKLVPKEDALAHFAEHLALVDSVNTGKQLFHFITDGKLDGVVYFNDTDLRPVPGDHFIVRGYAKLNRKTDKRRLQPLTITATDQVMNNRVKEISGFINVKENAKGPFGFIDDVYVPGFLIRESRAYDEAYVRATAIRNDRGWQVVRIEVSRDDVPPGVPTESKEKIDLLAVYGTSEARARTQKLKDTEAPPPPPLTYIR